MVDTTVAAKLKREKWDWMKEGGGYGGPCDEELSTEE